MLDNQCWTWFTSVSDDVTMFKVGFIGIWSSGVDWRFCDGVLVNWENWFICWHDIDMYDIDWYIDSKRICHMMSFTKRLVSLITHADNTCANFNRTNLQQWVLGIISRWLWFIYIPPEIEAGHYQTIAYVWRLVNLLSKQIAFWVIGWVEFSRLYKWRNTLHTYHIIHLQYRLKCQ